MTINLNLCRISRGYVQQSTAELYRSAPFFSPLLLPNPSKLSAHTIRHFTRFDVPNTNVVFVSLTEITKNLLISKMQNVTKWISVELFVVTTPVIIVASWYSIKCSINVSSVMIYWFNPLHSKCSSQGQTIFDDEVQGEIKILLINST